MAIIQHGKFDDFTVYPSASVRSAYPALEDVTAVFETREAARAAQPVELDFPVSDTPRGLALKTFTLHKGFEGFLQGLLNKKNEIYFISLAWDLSGEPQVQRPAEGTDPATCSFAMKAKTTREFLGSGLLLFPARKITSGLALRIWVCECDRDIRDFGKTMEEVANAIDSSELGNVLRLISAASGATTATLEIVGRAATELAKLIGGILQGNSDDYVDFFEGYYPVSTSWDEGSEEYEGYASRIGLTRLV